MYVYMYVNNLLTFIIICVMHLQVMTVMEAPETLDMMICLKEIAVVYRAQPENVAKVGPHVVIPTLFIYVISFTIPSVLNYCNCVRIYVYR